jgi:hypothetical protein
MRAVLDDLQPVTPRELEDRIHVARKTVEMRREDGARPRRDRALHRARIQRERGRIDIGEHRRQSGDARNLRNDPERERRDDDLRARRKIHRLENEVQCDAPVLRRTRAHVARSEKLREFLFERLDVRALDELFASAALLNDLIQFRHDPRAESSDGVHGFLLLNCKRTRNPGTSVRTPVTPQNQEERENGGGRGLTRTRVADE